MNFSRIFNRQRKPLPPVNDGIPEEFLLRQPLNADAKLPKRGGVDGAFGENCWLEIDTRCLDEDRLMLEVHARNSTPPKDVTIRIGHVRGSVTVVVAGPDSTLTVGHSPKLNAHFGLGLRSDVVMGDQTTSSGLIVQAQDSRVQIGRDCQIGDQATIMAAAHHGVVDLSSGKPKLVKYDADTRIGNHVWLGHRCYIGAKATVGDGSIVAAGASVVSDMPAHCLIAGNPAQVRRRKTGWSRFHDKIDEGSEAFFDSLDPNDLQ